MQRRVQVSPSECSVEPKVKSQKSVLDVEHLGAEQQILKIQPQSQGPDPGTSWARLKQVPCPTLPADGALILGRALAWGGGSGEGCCLCPLYSCMAGLVTCGRAREGSSYVLGPWDSILPMDILGCQSC